MKKILIVDDDRDNLDVLSEMLEKSFQPIPASSGKEGIRLAVQEQPAIILLDVNMPDMNGFEVCRRLREQPATRHIPVIMLTTVSDMDSRVEGLTIGADDYITKPFNARDLLARIQARLRRVELDVKREEAIACANLVLDPKTGEVKLNGEEIHLTRVEFELLRYFLERRNQVVERAKLLGDLWPDAVVTERTVDTHMGNLRKKIKKARFGIKTVYGSGYILKVDE
ncbi:MAG: response regulator transcription factor [Oligoflexia bacterium]|nr:response regulator transcription factor [Oligoflexia bacterium]